MGGLATSIGVVALDWTWRRGYSIGLRFADSYSLSATGVSFSLNTVFWDLKLRLGGVIDATMGPGVEIGLLKVDLKVGQVEVCLLYTSPSPRDGLLSRMPSSA